jgi:hypothetical protein
VQFIAIDGVGNTSSVRSVPLKVDLIAPTVTLTGPTGSITGTVSVTGTAADDQSIASIVWYRDGVAQASTKSSPFSFSWNTRFETKTSHTIYARVTDAAGHVTQSASRIVTVR